ncbi:hypothetical protein C8F04DRAFT_1387408 [Mycena alexandri]|uniref:XPG-I domain-containing protein n=1 Tax=Mycena alexandri TaxID=1745969 RepID=A0AAD6TL65_9AGAR|nr:hypothetical protein C8F04DRAFT_1387408 [Mycena alexandri]
MDVSESVIDPALLEASENDRRGPTTDGAIPSSFTSTSLNSPRPPSALRTRTFTKEDIQSWAASNYAPRRDANESRAEYERRLTLVTRKTPLAEACNKLSVNAPKSATLERLRSELAKYWFTQARSRPNATSQSNAPSLPSRQHPGDVLNFYPPAEPLQFAPPPGILPTVSSTARGEFRGAVPLFHLAPSTTRSTRDPTGDTSSALRTEARTQRRRRSSRPSRPSTSVPNVPTAGPSRSGTPPSSSPPPVRRPSRVRAPRGTSSSEDEEEEEEVDSDADDLIKQYGVEGANAEEILGYDDEDDEDGSDDDDEGASTSDEEAAHAAFKQTTRVQAAPGEAEAELAQLNADGRIDGIITEDSDAFVFGARLVIRTLGPSVEHNSIVYSADCIENTDGVCLDRAGLLLCVLLLGGDYDAGVPGVGPTTAHVLALLGFGRDLVNILDSFTGAQLDRQLIGWRNTVREELCTNSRGRLGQRQPKLAEKILDTFPSLEVANLYMNPLTSASPQYIGPMPSFNSWTPREPNIFDLSGLCSSLFGWNGEHLLKKFNSNLWPGVVFRMFSSRFVLHNARMKLIASPVTRAVVLKVMKASGNNRASMDLAELNLHRVRVSTEKFISLAQLNDSPAIPDREIKLVTIPQVILSVAMRDTSLEETDLTEMPSDVEVDSDSSSGSEAEMLENSHGDSEREVNDDYGKEADEVMEIVDSDEEALLDAHGKLSAKGGVIDLTEDI